MSSKNSYGEALIPNVAGFEAWPSKEVIKMKTGNPCRILIQRNVFLRRDSEQDSPQKTGFQAIEKYFVNS